MYFIFQIVLMFNILVHLQVEAKVTDEEYALMPTLFHLDDFDSCMALGSKALYCTATLQLAPVDIENPSKVWKIIQDVINDPRNYRHDLLRHGICVPKTCPLIDAERNDEKALENGISTCYTSLHSGLGLTAVVTELSCETDEPKYPIDNFDISVAVIAGILICLVFGASIYDGVARRKQKEEYEKIINNKFGRIVACFSLSRNWDRLRSPSTSPDANALRCINGMRFYNTQLVIIVHVYMIAAAGPVYNPKYIENLTLKPENMLFLNGACAIQTFMLMTGFLISYNFLLVFEKAKDFQLRYIIMAFVNRYIRLTPSLLVMGALSATWQYRVGTGPTWNASAGSEYRNCRKNLWANLLYINNYYDVEHMCMQHTWYLATDTQVFVVLMVIVMIMWKYQKHIKLVLGISAAIGIVIPGMINYYYDFDIVIRQYPEAFYSFYLKVQQWHVTYSSFLPNIGGYVLGMTCGYIFYLNRNTNKKLIGNKIYVTIWWVLILGLPLGVIFYGIFIYQEDYEYTRLSAAVYVSLQRNIFALGICIGLYGFIEGVGWLFRDAVVWSPLQVLGRLTYCTYLVHAAVIRIRAGQGRLPAYTSNYTTFSQSAGDAVVSYIFATLLCLFVELPVSALHSLMVPKLPNRQNTNSEETRIEKCEAESKKDSKQELRK